MMTCRIKFNVLPLFGDACLVDSWPAQHEVYSYWSRNGRASRLATEIERELPRGRASGDSSFCLFSIFPSDTPPSARYCHPSAQTKGHSTRAHRCFQGTGYLRRFQTEHKANNRAHKAGGKNRLLVSLPSHHCSATTSRLSHFLCPESSLKPRIWTERLISASFLVVKTIQSCRHGPV